MCDSIQRLASLLEALSLPCVPRQRHLFHRNVLLDMDVPSLIDRFISLTSLSTRGSLSDSTHSCIAALLLIVSAIKHWFEKSFQISGEWLSQPRTCDCSHSLLWFCSLNAWRRRYSSMRPCVRGNIHRSGYPAIMAGLWSWRYRGWYVVGTYRTSVSDTGATKVLSRPGFNHAFTELSLQLVESLRPLQL